jgi:hypothetical protein
VVQQGRGLHVASTSLYQQLGSAYAVIDMPGSYEEDAPGTTSKMNRFEAHAVAHMVKQLAKEYQHSQPLSIGIISPYAAQVDVIARALQHSPGLHSSSSSAMTSASTAAAVGDGSIVYEVKSVDGFQGVLIGHRWLTWGTINSSPTFCIDMLSSLLKMEQTCTSILSC